MPDNGMDRDTERRRYDAAARRQARVLRSGGTLDGIDSSPEWLRPPYNRYHQLLRQYAESGTTVLEIGTGNGVHAEVLADTGARVIGLDISAESLRLCRLRSDSVALVCADMAAIPLGDSSVDLLVSAGSLSYADPSSVNSEIWRVLRPGGTLLVVDSLNHNPVYRLNRWINYRRGLRTRSTVERMPTLARIDQLRAPFRSSSVEFFGKWLFLHTPIAWVRGRQKASESVQALERFGPDRFAFKFVLCATGFDPRWEATVRSDQAR